MSYNKLIDLCERILVKLEGYDKRSEDLESFEAELKALATPPFIHPKRPDCPDCGIELEYEVIRGLPWVGVHSCKCGHEHRTSLCAEGTGDPYYFPNLQGLNNETKP